MSRFIAIEGPIGVGKTSLAKRLAQSWQADLLLEQPQDNPFLERFYRESRAAALATQLSFLLQRERQLSGHGQGDSLTSDLIADFIVDKDRLFAGLTLDAEELDLYEQIYARLTLDMRVPDLVVYLQAPEDVLLNRIAQRGRAGEEYIDAKYLQRLNMAYADFFQKYDRAPVLAVDAAHFNPLVNESDYAQIRDQIQATCNRHDINWEPALT